MPESISPNHEEPQEETKKDEMQHEHQKNYEHQAAMRRVERPNLDFQFVIDGHEFLRSEKEVEERKQSVRDNKDLSFAESSKIDENRSRIIPPYSNGETMPEGRIDQVGTFCVQDERIYFVDVDGKMKVTKNDPEGNNKKALENAKFKAGLEAPLRGDETPEDAIVKSRFDDLKKE
jgi:hypothetical protein